MGLNSSNLEFDLAIIQHPSITGSQWKLYLSQMDLSAFHSLRFQDLGEFAGYDSDRMAETIHYLIQKGILPIVVGGDIDLIRSMHKWSEKNTIPYSLSWIQPTWSLQNLEIWKGQMVVKKIYGIAMQRQLIHRQELKTNFPDIVTSYLSDFRKSSNSVDPILRRSEWCFFSPLSIRFSDFPAKGHPISSGLYSEEAASICRMAGAGENNQLFFIHTWQAKQDSTEQCDYNIAQLVWYFMEGFSIKKLDASAQKTQLTEYVVDLPEFDSEICFCKSEITGKWWFKSPYSGELSNANILIPCTYEEYLQTIQSNVPKRIAELIL
ncbi:MAG: hypothetical protein IPM48_11465 [Saprospiraceae bacterium]|nr:hypothetical protein [Saprospiraceae bacterium]